MSFLINGSVVGGIILYNNSEDIMIETLRMYTTFINFSKKGFLRKQQIHLI